MKYIALPLALLFSCQGEIKQIDPLNLKNNLEGDWRADAFNGELHEQWNLNAGGFWEQRGYYIENNDTTYRALTRIEQVGGDLILFSVIRDSNPKIFKSVSRNGQEIIFENSDYKNPYQVKYEFLENGNYRRTITGIENDSTVAYVFNFTRAR